MLLEKSIPALRRALWFVIKLNMLALPMYLAVYFGLQSEGFQQLWAAGLSQSLSSLGYETSLEGHNIGVKSGQSLYQINLSWDSTGWKSLYAMFALVFASGIGGLRQKITFLAFALPAIAFLNLLRVVTTSLVYVNYGLGGFDLVHGFLWSTMMIAAVVGMWYYLYLKDKR